MTKRRPRITRRRFLVAAGSTVGGLATIESATASATAVSDDEEYVIGAIEKLMPPTRLRVRDAGHSVEITLAPEALVLRDAPGELSDFLLGEEVIAQGARDGDAFIATSLASLYRLVAGVVVARESGRVTTTKGVVQLIPETRYQVAGELAPMTPTHVPIGSSFTFLGRIDPASGELVALRVYPE